MAENIENYTKEYVSPNVGKEMSFRARWSEALAKEGVTAIANFFLDNYAGIGLSVVEAMFIIHLFEYKWTVDQPYPSLKTIASKMGKSEDTVRRLARGLEEKELIKRNYRTGQTNTYNLNPLIKRLGNILLDAKLHRGGMQNECQPSAPMQTKEEPLRINNNNTSVKSIRDILGEKPKIPYHY